MPVLTPAVPASVSRDITLPVPLEPDIEHIRRRLGNRTTPPCFALIGLIHPPSSPQLNCSLLDDDDNGGEIKWQLVPGHDPIYYVLPVVLITGIACNTLSASLLTRLIVRPPVACHGDLTSDVYLLWLTVTSVLWLVCTGIRALPDYVTHHVIESLQWTDGYVGGVSEWLSYSCLWLLVTMSLNVAVRLTTINQAFSVNYKPCDQSSKSLSNDVHHHHHHHQDHGGERCREVVICVAIYIVCIVSCLPQFFAFQMVDSLDAETNSTSVVSQLDEQLISSFEYSVVYYWYIVCLTVLLPVPFLILISVLLVVSLRRMSRTRRKQVPVKTSDVVQASSALPRTQSSSSACTGRTLNWLRLHIVLIVIYLLFTCPRATLTCLHGVFVVSSRHSTAGLTMSSDDMVYAVLDSVGELVQSVYQASWLPLLASYHSNFRRLLVSSSSSCCRRRCRCCSRQQSVHINDNSAAAALTTATTSNCGTRKSVKFDMETVEFEIQYY